MGLGHTHYSCLQGLLEGMWDTEPIPGSGSPLKELTTLHNQVGSASRFLILPIGEMPVYLLRVL